MNRRELAKNGFLGLCGFVVGKFLPEKVSAETIQLAFHGTDTNSLETVFYVCGADGKFRRLPLRYGHDFSGPDWDDNEYWKKTDVPPGWEFLNDPEEDGYNDLQC